MSNTQPEEEPVTDRFAGVLGAARGGGLKASTVETPYLPPELKERMALIREAYPNSQVDFEQRPLRPTDRFVVVGVRGSGRSAQQLILGVTDNEADLGPIGDHAATEDIQPLWTIDLTAPNRSAVWQFYDEYSGDDPTPLWRCDVHEGIRGLDFGKFIGAQQRRGNN